MTKRESNPGPPDGVTKPPPPPGPPWPATGTIECEEECVLSACWVPGKEPIELGFKQGEDSITICGVKYSGDFFRSMATSTADYGQAYHMRKHPELGVVFERVVGRWRGMND